MDKLRLGVIGVGSVVREIYQHLYFRSEYSHLLSIEAVAELNEQGLATFCDEHEIAPDRRFTDYRAMIDAVPLDAVQVNTPDAFHRDPTVYALEHGLDVMVPKPLTDKTEDARAMIEAARRHGRLIGVDFHKREDPRLKEVAARYQSGAYGGFQTAVWYMIDKLSVADPNHQPPFFATADFVEKNSPISFLTVHMADALMHIVQRQPVAVRATGWKQKLPSLAPISADGYDLCDVEVVYDNGGVAHIFTGWALPNTAHALTVQGSRIICTDGLIDLELDKPGVREIVPEGVIERNPLFRNFTADGTVTGYGMSSPGRIYQSFLKARNGQMADSQRAAMMSPFELGYYTTVVCEAAEQSLEQGQAIAHGVVRGIEVPVSDGDRSVTG